MNPQINFFQEDTTFKLRDEERIIHWLQDIAQKEGYEIEEINYIFCSDDYLLEINQQYLSHDYYTDIVTFDNSETPRVLTSDIFISIDRITENANELKVAFEDELNRVMIHGLLHLLGYMDKTDDEKILMRQKEDTCLSLLN